MPARVQLAPETIAALLGGIVDGRTTSDLAAELGLNWYTRELVGPPRTDGRAMGRTRYDRYREIGLPPERQRIASLPRSPRDTLARGWPELLDRLEARYGPHWS